MGRLRALLFLYRPWAQFWPVWVLPEVDKDPVGVSSRVGNRDKANEPNSPFEGVEFPYAAGVDTDHGIAWTEDVSDEVLGLTHPWLIGRRAPCWL